MECFRDRVLAVAVGRVTAKALEEEVVSRVLLPETERMGAITGNDIGKALLKFRGLKRRFLAN